MTEESAKLRIPYIAAAQAQKHVTHNEAMTLLDTLVQLSVLDKDLLVPPGSPAEGDCYIVAGGGGTAAGSWAGWEKRVARYIDGVWRSYLPGQGNGAGWIAWVQDEDAMYRFDGAGWTLAGIEGPQGPQGPAYQPDAAVDVIAGRSSYDGEAAAFSVLVVSDSGNAGQPTLYFKLSAASADWSAGITWLPQNAGPAFTVRAATTVDIATPTALNSGDTIDGVTLAGGDLVLVKDQAMTAENGLYVIGVSPARASGLAAYDQHAGALVTVQEGTINGGTVWQCTSDRGGTLGTDPITFLRGNLPAMSAYQAADLEVSADAGALTIAQNGAAPLFIPPDATLGVYATGAAFRLWVLRFADGALGVVNCSDGKNIWPLTAWALADATAISAGSDSAGMIYAASARSHQAFTVAGFIEWGVNGLATLGTWDLTNLLRTQLFGPGVPLPNQEINTWVEIPTAHVAGTATMNLDNTVPQSTEGAQVVSLAVNPSSAANVLDCSASVYLAKQSSSWNAGVAAMFRNADADAIAANGAYPSASTNWDATIPLHTRIPAADTTSLKVRMGTLPAATAWYFNGRGGNNLFGGIPLSNLRCRELMT